jgi:branched-subunit amino acid aminotransferase/4-amino-4-deoxychorismate lyase
MSVFCFANNQIQPIQNAGVPVTDLLVQRGYGIFDFLRVAHDKPLFIDDHLDRFFNSAEIMRLPIPQTREEIKKIVDELIQLNQLPYSGMRLLIAGGDAPDGYTIEHPHLIIIQAPLAEPTDALPTTGITLATYNYQRQIPEVKTTDYLMAIWLQPWMKEQGADDILYHHDGVVSECPRSNFFLVTKEGVLVTAQKNMLKGVTRKNIIEVCRAHNIPLEIRDVNTSEFLDAKEAFITSSTKRIIPVHKIDKILLKPNYEQSIAKKIYKLLVLLEK